MAAADMQRFMAVYVAISIGTQVYVHNRHIHRNDKMTGILMAISRDHGVAPGRMSSATHMLGDRFTRPAHPSDVVVPRRKSELHRPPGLPAPMTTSTTPRTDVLAAVVSRAHCYLVCQRPMSKRHGGRWEFPGGKMEPGEPLLDAANRELTEELGVTATRVGAPLFSAHDDGSAFVISFVPTEIQGEPACLEHADLRWASLEEISRLDLAPSDRRFVEFLLGRRSHPGERRPS